MARTKTTKRSSTTKKQTTSSSKKRKTPPVEAAPVRSPGGSDVNSDDSVSVVSQPNKKAKYSSKESGKLAPGRSNSYSSYSSDSSSDEERPMYVKTTKDGSYPNLLQLPIGLRAYEKDQDPKYLQKQANKSTRSVVQAIVTTCLFPRVKFVNRAGDLDYSTNKNSICQFVLTRAKLPADFVKSEFWEKAKTWVMRTICRCRSDKANQFRIIFYEWLRNTLPEDCIDKNSKKLTTLPKYGWEDFQKGRANEDCYRLFFSLFVPHLEKRSNWDDRVANAENDKDVVSVSSEAFGLLILENYWDRWLDFYAMSNGELATKKGTKMRSVQSTVLPKYTRGGTTYDKDAEKKAGVKIRKGWSLNGINRFNQLYDFVLKDRKKHPLFFSNWLESTREISFGSSKKSSGGGKMKAATNYQYSMYSLQDDEEEGVSSHLKEMVAKQSAKEDNNEKNSSDDEESKEGSKDESSDGSIETDDEDEKPKTKNRKKGTKTKKVVHESEGSDDESDENSDAEESKKDDKNVTKNRSSESAKKPKESEKKGGKAKGKKNRSIEVESPRRSTRSHSK